MTLTWSNPPSRAWPELSDAYVAAIRRGVRQIADRWAPIISAYMKENHPWQNITGAAEAGLYTEVEQMGMDMVTIILSHGDDIEYGIWLELKFGGRDAILAPAIDVFAPRIWADVLAMMR